MDWTRHKLSLEYGETIEIRPRGNSMEPKIKSGQLLKIESAVGRTRIKVGDIVFCNVKGRYYVHLVTAMRRTDFARYSYQISNNKGRANGWIPRGQIYGKVVRISD